jgi:mono/diheme cytochrome c family protein
MMERTDKIYAYTALFNTPDEIIHAARAVSGAGYTRFDVNTPYPVHGMDRAMNLKPSKLGFVTLFFGLSGALLALLIMYYIMTYDYPMIIGGKPFFALPAFIPITFEVTVLLATLSTVIGMIAIFFNFPSNSHPLHDTDYMRSVSLDKYGIAIQADDPKFNESDVTALLSGLGAHSITPVYYPPKEEFALFNPKFMLFLLSVAVITSLATYVTLNHILYLPPFDFMWDQEKVDPQEKSEFYDDNFAMRTPVRGTVARGFLPYPGMGNPNPTEVLTNPLPATNEVLELGRKKYDTFCSPCHGDFGDGDSRLRGQFPNPPTFHSDRSRQMSDGMLYHIMTNGQNIMPSYAPQVTREERWAVVHFIRVLQRAKNAAPSDVQEIKKDNSNGAQ